MLGRVLSLPECRGALFSQLWGHGHQVRPAFMGQVCVNGRNVARVLGSVHAHG